MGKRVIDSRYEKLPFKERDQPINIRTIYSTEDQLTVEFQFNPSQNFVAHLNFIFPVITKLFISLLEFEGKVGKVKAKKIAYIINNKLHDLWPRIKKEKPIQIIYLRHQSEQLIISSGERGEKDRFSFTYDVNKVKTRSMKEYTYHYSRLKSANNFTSNIITMTEKGKKPWERFQDVHFGFDKN